MEDSTPASQKLTHLHQQWMSQEMLLSKVKYTRDAQYMEYLKQKFINLPEMLMYVKLLAFSFKAFMISKTHIHTKALQKTVT